MRSPRVPRSPLRAAPCRPAVRSGLLTLLLWLLSLAARGQPAPTGPLSGNAPLEQREVDVNQTDGGYFVDPTPSEPEKLQPPRLVAESPAAYPAELQGTGLAGAVKLELLVDEHGAVADARVIESVAPRLDEAALAAARGLRFQPALLKGAPIATRIHFTYEFRPAPAAQAPVAHLKGQIRAKGTRRPLPGATVLIGGRPAAEADVAGRFEAESPPGTVVVEVSAPGHRPERFTERLEANQTLEVVYSLVPLQVNPYETFVVGERQRTEVSRITLRGPELRDVPGTQGDPFRVVMLMPGVGSLASGISYPVVRGSVPAATGYFIDGVRVPALFHLVVGPAVVHPEFIDSIDFYPGPVPVQYGRLMGGAVDATTSHPREDRLHATAYADLINAGGFVEAPIAATGTSVTLAGRVSYTPWLIARMAPLFSGGANKITPQADFYDYQARIEQKLGTGRLRLFIFGSSDLVGEESSGPHQVSFHLLSAFHRADLRYRQPLGIGEGELGVTYGIQRIGLTGDSNGAHLGDYVLGEHGVVARASWSARLAPGLGLSVGGDVDTRQSRTTIGANLQAAPGSDPSLVTFRQPLVLTTFSGAYAQLVWQPTAKLTLIPGLRADDYHLVPGIDHAAVDPRLTARWDVTERLALTAGVGSVHQPPTVLLNVPVFDTASLRYGLQSGLQTSAGTGWKPLDGFELDVAAYYNPLFRAVELSLLDVLANRRALEVPGFDPGTRGRSYGLEVMLRHPVGDNWFGWISYSYQRAERLRTFSRFDDANKVIDTVTAYVPFAFEQVHVLNAALSYKFPGGFSAGAVVHFNTGRPQSGELTSRSFHPGTDPVTGQPIWVFDDRDRVARLPPFFRVDVRLSKTWLFDDFILEGYLDVLNASLSQEVVGYTYDVLTPPLTPTTTLDKEAIRLPIVVPMLGVKGTY